MKRFASGKFPKDAARRLALPVLLLTAISASAQNFYFESEPNNTPANANAVEGATLLVGTMESGDQDGFMWTVSDEDAQKRWVFELQGIPGRLTIAQVVRIEFAENGVDVLGADRLMKMGTRDGYTPSTTRPLIFEPGKYLIGLAYGGGGGGGGLFRPPTANLSFGDEGSPETTPEVEAETDPDAGAYRFIIRESDGLGVQSANEKGTSREQSFNVDPGDGLAVFETRDSVWYAFDFDPEDTGQRWDIRAQVPVGRSLDATLIRADGTELDSRRTDGRGHLTFPGITPTEDTYYIRLEPRQAGHVTLIGSEAVGKRVDGEEAEPNGSWSLANRIQLSPPLQALSNEKWDTDYFRFSLDEGSADELLTIRAESEPGEKGMRFCLYDADGDSVQCRTGDTPLELPDLYLSPGEWGLRVNRTEGEFAYRVSFESRGSIQPGIEAEPNDSLALATGVPPNNRIKGALKSREWDSFRFLVAEEPQLWRFQVIGEGIHEINYYDGSGSRGMRIRPASGQRRVRMDNMFLMPGKHYLRIGGKNVDNYTLLARPLGPPDPNGEREPNNDSSRMQRLAIGQTRTGLLADPDDSDNYRFFLANHDHIRLTIKPPADGKARPNLYWNGKHFADGRYAETGQAMTLQGVFPPGDYRLALDTNDPSDAEYRVSLERLPRYSCPADCEPSNLEDYYGASPLPPDLVLEGTAGDWRDYDDYLLPVREQPNRLVVRAPVRPRGVRLATETEDDRLDFDDEIDAFTGIVPPGGPHLLRVDSRREPYRLELEFDHGPDPLDETDLPVELTLRPDVSTVSAFRQYGQRVGGSLELVNNGTVALDGTLEATTSDYRWAVELSEDAFTLGPGARTEVPVEVSVPSDAWGDRPVRISVRAVNEAGAQSETFTDIAVDGDAPPVDSTLNWTVPDALRGGFNALWLPFGAKPAGELPPKMDGEELARNGLVYAGQRMNCCRPGSEGIRPSLTWDLPGDEPVPVAGVAVNLFGASAYVRYLRSATLLLSRDGENWEEALAFATQPVMTEQYFALDEAVTARFARLQPEATFSRGGGPFQLGEFKVILSPDFDLSGGKGFDIARPEVGGHLVWDSPPEHYSPTEILDAERGSPKVRIRDLDRNLQYVLGFHENRAAQIRRIEWIHEDGTTPEYLADKVVVSFSTDSPVGPWQTAGEFVPESSTTPSVLELEPGHWARFVKFNLVQAGKGREKRTVGPNLIRVLERAPGDNYRSVLSEWGHANPMAIYEEQRGVPPRAQTSAGDNRSRETAALLSPAETVGGQVALDRWDHWYRLDVPEDANTLTLAMTGKPTVRTVLMLEAADGSEIPVKRLEKSTPRLHIFEAFAEPGSTVYLKVAEPPRNVVFSWDTSASVGSYLPTIYNSLTAFINGVVPGRDAANFVPFGRTALLDTWLGEPYMLQTILNDHPRGKSSSSGEQALKRSARTLAQQPGTKAIMIITDGAVVHDGAMWREMREVQPRIFGAAVAGSKPRHYDLFQDWAAVNGGHFAQIVYDGEMEVAFDRAATLMRRPADYTLTAQAEFREAPGPGFLRVISSSGDSGGSGAATTAGGAGVELILDASGSMLQRMEGKRRIVVAREVLTDIVQDVIPAGTPVALRVFGHKEVGACRTDLEIPLAPLDPAAAVEKIDGIQAMNLAKTPIADSLAAVEDDLGSVDGRATVILVTDGEETCDGDPAAVIEGLKEGGIDVTVNIVGFAIDDEVLAATFEEWAEAGGGRYFSANNQQALGIALEEALQIPFTVYDNGGEALAEGLVDGEPVELEQGLYRVVVASSPRRTFEDVEVRGEDEATLALP